MTNARLYRITNDRNHYFTGRLPNRNQVLMGVQMPEIVMVEFDPAGAYLTISSRIVATQGPNGGITREVMRRLSVAAILEWQHEVAFVPETIAVSEFFLPERCIGIKELPDHYQDVLDKPAAYPEDELQALTEDINSWRASGDFVLYFTEDYYLNEAGELVSS